MQRPQKMCCLQHSRSFTPTLLLCFVKNCVDEREKRFSSALPPVISLSFRTQIANSISLRIEPYRAVRPSLWLRMLHSRFCNDRIITNNSIAALYSSRWLASILTSDFSLSLRVRCADHFQLPTVPPPFSRVAVVCFQLDGARLSMHNQGRESSTQQTSITSQVAGFPPLRNVGVNKILVETPNTTFVEQTQRDVDNFLTMRYVCHEYIVLLRKAVVVVSC